MMERKRKSQDVKKQDDKNQGFKPMHGDEFTHPVFASLDHLLSGKPERR